MPRGWLNDVELPPDANGFVRTVDITAEEFDAAWARYHARNQRTRCGMSQEDQEDRLAAQRIRALQKKKE